MESSRPKIMTFESLRYGKTASAIVHHGIAKFILSQPRLNVGVDRVRRVQWNRVQGRIQAIIRILRTNRSILKDRNRVYDADIVQDLGTLRDVSINHIQLIPVDDTDPHGFPVFRIDGNFGTPVHVFHKKNPKSKITVVVDGDESTRHRNQPVFYCWCIFHLETSRYPDAWVYLGFSGTTRATVATLLEYENPRYEDDKPTWKPSILPRERIPMPHQAMNPPPFWHHHPHIRPPYRHRDGGVMSRSLPIPVPLQTPPPHQQQQQLLLQQQEQGAITTTSSTLTAKVSPKHSVLSSLSMKFVPRHRRNLFVSIPKKTIPLPFGTNDFIQVDREPEMEGICLFCGFLVLFDDSTKQDLVPLQVLNALKKGHNVSMNRLKNEDIAKIRDEVFNIMNPHRNKWSFLLWAEQLQIEIDIRNYDLHEINLKQRSNFVQTSEHSQYIDFVISVPDAPEQRPHVYVGMRVQLRPSEESFDKSLKRLYENVHSSNRFVSPSCMFCTSSSSSSTIGNKFGCKYCAEMRGETEKLFVKRMFGDLLSLEVHAAVQSRKDCNVVIRVCLPTKESNTISVLNMLRFLKWNVRFDTTMQRRSFAFMRNATRHWKSKFGSDSAFDTFRKMCLSDSFSNKYSKEHRITWYNKNLNERQRGCVRTFLFHPSKPCLPTIVFGPPGTGKTMVVVEAAAQALSQTDSSRVLIVAPSNAAVDVVLNRLHDQFLNKYIKTQKHNGYTSFKTFARRLNAPTRMPSMIIGSTMLYSDIDPKTGTCFVPSRRDLSKGVRLIACTCACFGYLKMQGRLNGIFTHIIVDEASQAWEPETMVALSVIQNETRVMIAGDPKQLGPATRCHKADRYGLGLSLQERLMSLPTYSPRSESKMSKNHHRHLIQLNRNYRSHSSMLKIPSKLFYGGMNALIPCADPKKVDASLSWHRLKGHQFPVMFLDVPSGRHHHTIDSRSLKNKAEARVVVDIVKDLLNDENLNFTTNDIGVVASFRAQVLLIRTMLRGVGLSGIRVGSIDDYQGQEENVVIVSTVFAGRHQSSPKRASRSDELDLGLLKNPRRFNVAVTRASSLLVVIGKSNSIRRDPCWKDLISLCMEMGTYEVIGDGLKQREEEDDNDDETNEDSKYGFPYDPSKNLQSGFMPWRVMM